MKTIDEIIALGKSVNVTIKPEQVFFDSNGTYSISFTSQNQATKFSIAVRNHIQSQGNKLVDFVDFDDDVPLADWEQKFFAERRKQKFFN